MRRHPIVDTPPLNRLARIDFGDAVVEPAGADHVHIGRNLGPVPTILQVIYPNPGCDFD